MEFSFSDDQWDVLCNLIAKVGGEPVVWLRGDLEQDITRYFVHDGLDRKIAVALERVSAAAGELAAALEYIAGLSKHEAEKNAYFAEYIIRYDVNDRMKFSSELRQYAAAVEKALNEGYKEILDRKPSRGRPYDESLIQWSRSLLMIAEKLNWNISDVRGRTSNYFIDIQLKIAEYAASAGFNHCRVVRRALVRAIDKARNDLEDERGAPFLQASLTAGVSGDQLNREIRTFFCVE